MPIINIDEDKVFETTPGFNLNMMHINGGINGESIKNSPLMLIDNPLKWGSLPSSGEIKVFEAI